MVSTGKEFSMIVRQSGLWTSTTVFAAYFAASAYKHALPGPPD